MILKDTRNQSAGGLGSVHDARVGDGRKTTNSPRMNASFYPRLNYKCAGTPRSPAVIFLTELIINYATMSRKGPKTGRESCLDRSRTGACKRDPNSSLNHGIGFGTSWRRVLDRNAIQIANLSQRLMSVAIDNNIFTRQLINYSELYKGSLCVVTRHRTKWYGMNTKYSVFNEQTTIPYLEPPYPAV